MLMENALSYMKSEDILDLPQEWYDEKFYWNCPKCGELHEVYLSEVDESFIDNMLRNPSDEIWMCPDCGKIIPITTQLVTIVDVTETPSYICSDGTFLYLIRDEKAYRI